MRQLETTLTPVEEVREHPDNPRRGDVEAIKESIRTNGVYRPIVVQESTGFILAGNHTYRAMKELGEEKVPVVFVDVDDTAARRIMIADNRTADLGDYDTDTLTQLLESLDGDLEGTGYTSDWQTELENLAGEGDNEANLDDYYTPKVTTPVYEPKLDRPPAETELVDDSKTEQLIETIDLAEIPTEAKKFLRLAATRHLKFSYSKIGSSVLRVF